MKVVSYCDSFHEEWNAFVAGAKNGTFLFDRRYLEYHADRFTDCSLLFYDDRDQLIALLPASRHDNSVISHGGLTYGGMVTTSAMKTAVMLDVFSSGISFLKEKGLCRLVYKPVPHIFHKLPAEEDLYALFRCDARLVRRDASAAIWLPERLKFAKGKREGVRKALRAGVVVLETTDYDTFFAIGLEVMRDRHNLQPVHTAAEMQLLAKNFPSGIRLFAAYQEERMLAGAIAYFFDSSVHLQYMYNSDEGLRFGALDLVLDHLVNLIAEHYRYLSFGVSTENAGMYLNEGLMHQKEMFGARCVVHDFYEIDLV